MKQFLGDSLPEGRNNYIFDLCCTSERERERDIKGSYTLPFFGEGETFYKKEML